jgi:hypothetical protein
MDEKDYGRSDSGVNASGIIEGQPPPIGTPPNDLPAPDIELPEPSHMEVFWAWEKLRILYNVVLISVVVVTGWTKGAVCPLFAILLLPEAILANVCFCVGLVCESYLALLGMPRSLSRPVLFCLGLFLSSLFAIERTSAAIRFFD